MNLVGRYVDPERGRGGVGREGSKIPNLRLFSFKLHIPRALLKQNKYVFVHTCIHLTVGLGMHMII